MPQWTVSTLPGAMAPALLARSRRAGWSLAAFLGLALSVWAGDSFTVRTNYYPVTGRTWTELRQSMSTARPWKNGPPLDGRTDWHVQWQFHLEETAQGARLRSFDLTTTVTITLPSWQAPADADPALVETWKRFFANLKRHEEGHLAIARQAAAAVRQRIRPIQQAPTLRQLTDQLNAAARAALAEFRDRDAEYDRITQHGLRQDAWRP